MSQEFSIAKVGGQHIKCFVDENGSPKFHLMTEDEVANAAVDSVLELGSDPNVNSKMARVLEEAEDHVLRTLKTNLIENVMHLMGFEKDSWGRTKGGWKIDHCNGRTSHASEYIAVKAKEILNAFDPTDILRDPKLIADVQEEFRTEFKSKYRNELRRKLYDALDKAVQVDADRIVEGIISGTDMQSIPKELVADIVGVKVFSKNKR